MPVFLWSLQYGLLLSSTPGDSIAYGFLYLGNGYNIKFETKAEILLFRVALLGLILEISTLAYTWVSTLAVFVAGSVTLGREAEHYLKLATLLFGARREITLHCGPEVDLIPPGDKEFIAFYLKFVVELLRGGNGISSSSKPKLDILFREAECFITVCSERGIEGKLATAVSVLMRTILLERQDNAEIES
jgi:hypothetical protein